LQAGQNKIGRTHEEIVKAIRDLSPADWVRLKKVARRYAAGRPMAADDLLQEGYARALDGRVCPHNVDVVRFLAEAMRSIAHGEQEKVGNKLATVSVSNTDEITPKAAAVPDPSMTAEESMIRDEEDRTVRQSIIALFTDDEAAQIIVEGMMDELEGEELRELCGLDERAYASKRRLIRRRVDKAYPKGWKP
jgi:RNA polymerase sigma-70 factor (ECF subfamily)